MTEPAVVGVTSRCPKCSVMYWPGADHLSGCKDRTVDRMGKAARGAAIPRVGRADPGRAAGRGQVSLLDSKVSPAPVRRVRRKGAA